MGKQKGLYVHGKQGNVLYYSWKEIPCMRIIPANVYQSPVVVAHKNANGLSTTMGASFRKLLADVIPYPKSMQMQTAVRLALLKWLKAGPATSQPPAAIPFISGLSFNEASLLRHCLRVPLTISAAVPNEITVLIPQMIPVTAFNAPPQTVQIQLKLAAACCNIKTGKALGSSTHGIAIPYDATGIPAQMISLPLEMPGDSLTMVAAALEYYTGKNGNVSLCLDKRFRAAEVLGGVVNMM